MRDPDTHRLRTVATRCNQSYPVLGPLNAAVSAYPALGFVGMLPPILGSTIGRIKASGDERAEEHV